MHKQSAKELVQQRTLSGFGVVLIDKGEGFFTTRQSGRDKVRTGSAFWLFPNVVHSYGPDQAWKERWLLFDGALCSAMAAQGYLDPARAVTYVGHDAEAMAAFGRAWRAYQAGGPHAVALASAALTEFIIRAATAKQAMGGATLRDHIAERAMRILDERAVEGVSPAEIARGLGVPHSTLRRRFSMATGFSLRDYAISVRLRRSQELLVTTKLPIAEVAYHAGFADPFYFTRLFTKRVGMTPSVFRRLGHP